MKSISVKYSKWKRYYSSSRDPQFSPSMQSDWQQGVCSKEIVWGSNITTMANTHSWKYTEEWKHSHSWQVTFSNEIPYKHVHYKDVTWAMARNCTLVQWLVHGEQQWKHQSSALLALCEGKPPVTGVILPQKGPVIYNSLPYQDDIMGLMPHRVGPQVAWMFWYIWKAV